jgi:hypothetical protein
MIGLISVVVAVVVGSIKALFAPWPPAMRGQIIEKMDSLASGRSGYRLEGEGACENRTVDLVIRHGGE